MSWVVSQFIFVPNERLLVMNILNLQVGTSSVVYPAAGFAPMLAAKGVPVAEFNLETTSATGAFR